MAYQLNSIMGAMSFMVRGMSCMASPISRIVAPTPCGDFRIFSFSPSVRGISLVVLKVHRIEPIETTPPIMKAMKVVVGIRPILAPSE